MTDDVPFWCVLKEFLKNVGISLGCLLLWFVAVAAIMCVCYFIAGILGPVITGFLMLFIFGGIVIFLILTAVVLAWQGAKNSCELKKEATDGGTTDPLGDDGD